MNWGKRLDEREYQQSYHDDQSAASQAAGTIKGDHT
jgi:hypothetical protein